MPPSARATRIGWLPRIALGALGLAAAAGWPAAGQVYLEGLDLGRPSQEAFRAWPPPQLVERAYWLPWSRAAFERAALFNRPVLFVLEVSWSSAARRALEGALADPRVLRAINAGFIAVRANADLRPDLRERYQTGRWPTVAFLMPNGMPMLSQVNELGVDQPITAGALDAESLLFLIAEGAKYWGLVPGELLRRGASWAATEGPPKPLLGVVDETASDRMALWMEANADRTDGGFGAAPKFVVPGLTEYAALRSARGSDDVLQHARMTVERTLGSPLYDRQQGGVRRLAAAPSFEDVQPEKLLSTNATLLRELAFALRSRDAPELRQALRETAGFLTTVLSREGGGFYLAQVVSESAASIDRIVLAGPNVLAGAALLRAAAVLEDPRLEAAGLRTLERIHGRALLPGAGVRHALEPVSTTQVYLETLADAALGFLDAYETTGRAEFLAAARTIVDDARVALRDPSSPALLDHAPDPFPEGLLANPRRPLRPNVRLARALLRLDLHGLGPEYRAAARGILGYFCGDLSGFRAHGVEAALAVEEMIAEPLRVRISGAVEEPRTRALRRAAATSPWVWTLIESGDEGEPARAEVRFLERSLSVEEPGALDTVIRELTRAGGGR